MILLTKKRSQQNKTIKIYARHSDSDGKGWFIVTVDKNMQTTKIQMSKIVDGQVDFKGTVAEVPLKDVKRMYLQRPNSPAADNLAFDVTDRVLDGKFVIMQGNGTWVAPADYNGGMVTERTLTRLIKIK